MNLPKYPVYIVSKGRHETNLTAKFFLVDGVDFTLVVEPQEYELYKRALPTSKIVALPFQDLGLGSYPARNWCWEDAKVKGYKRHWVFDDNIRSIRRLYKGKRVHCNANQAIRCIEDFTDRYENIGISGFNYYFFVTNYTKKPFVLNTHVYSAMLMNTEMPYRWRMKYNEDVDLCLQVLKNGLCTVLFSAFMVQKESTTCKNKGGNQTELYMGNSHEKKVLKARSLQEVWGKKYVEVKMRFNRPHHYVDWKKHFKHPLIRRKDIDWNAYEKVDNYGLELKVKGDLQSESLKKLIQSHKQKSPQKSGQG
jgi:hypothetical protein